MFLVEIDRGNDHVGHISFDLRAGRFHFSVGHAGGVGMLVICD